MKPAEELRHLVVVSHSTGPTQAGGGISLGAADEDLALALGGTCCQLQYAAGSCIQNISPS